MPPWEVETWPLHWVLRSLAVLDDVAEAPPFGALAAAAGPDGTGAGTVPELGAAE